MCIKFEYIINHVFGRMHHERNIQIMIAAGPQPKIHSLAMRKIYFVGNRSNVNLRALGFYSPYNNVKTESSTAIFKSYTVGILDILQKKSNRLPTFQWTKDISIYTNIVQPSFLYNSLANFLDVIRVTNTSVQKEVHRPSYPHFVRLLDEDLSSIKSRLSKDDGEGCPLAL